MARLMQRGLPKVRARISAYNGWGPWRNAGAAHMNVMLRVRGTMPSGMASSQISDCRNCKRNAYASLAYHEPPDTRPVCPVVWEDGEGDLASYPIPHPVI